MTDRNVCKEAFDKLVDDVKDDKKSAINPDDYYLFELGFRSAIEELLAIADTGNQSRQFVSPRFQMLAERILQSRPH